MESSLNNVVIPTFPRKQRTARKKKYSAHRLQTVNFKRSGCKRPSSSEKLLPLPPRRCHRHHDHHRIGRSERRETKVNGKADVKLEGVGGGGGNCEEEDDEDEEAAVVVESKIGALRRIVPGGHSLGPDKLFQETADYILALQSQIKAMRLLVSLLEGLDKHNTNFGG